MIYIGRNTLVALGLVLVSGVIAHAQETTPQKVADAMVLALASSRPAAVDDNPLAALALMSGFSEAEQKQISASEARIIDAASPITGESFPSGQDRYQIVLALNTWLVSRIPTPFTATTLETYEARMKAVDKQTLNDWHSAQAKLELRQNTRTLLLFAIAFQDGLWNGTAWKPGHPQRAIARLNALPKEAVSHWAEAAGVTETRFFVAYSLVAVDALFKGDTLQQELFDRALPLAKQRLEASKSK